MLSSKLLSLCSVFISIPPSFSLPRASTATQSHEERAATTGRDPSLSLENLMASVRAPPLYPVECFHAGEFALDMAMAADCNMVINEIILRLNDPMKVQTFGFDQTADIDLSLPENRSWAYGQCIVSLKSKREIEEDMFRPVDIAVVAQRIIQKCVVGSKEGHGGYGDIGSREKNFFVVLGGIKAPWILAVGNGTRLSLPTSNVTKGSDALKEDISNEDPGLSTRSSNKTNLIITDSYSLPIVCITPGMPAAGKISNNDCLVATETLLSLPHILIPQQFTTEPTGGVHVPNVHQSKNCFVTINTNARLSRSETFSYVKVAYYAAQIMQKCSLGGMVKLTPGEGGFFLSLTGVNPVTTETGLNALLNSTTSGLAIGGSPLGTS